MRIDFHQHFFPPSYVDHLSGRQEIPYVRAGRTPKDVFYGPDVSIPVMPAAVDVAKRLEDAERLGIDMEVLSVTLPGVDTLPIAEARDVARHMNHDTARVIADHPGRFAGLGSVPLQDIGAAITEMEYAVKQLRLSGIGIYSNVAGDPYVNKDYFDFFAAAAEMGAILFMHPTSPAMGHVVGTDVTRLTNVAYLADTTLAITNLILTGILERLPNLKIVFAHLGGSFPYTVGRWDHTFKRSPMIDREKLPLLPSEYLRRVYLDVVSMNPGSIRLAQESVGIEHLLFASDYPFIDIEGNLETVEKMGWPDSEKQLVFETNARKLLGI